MPASLSAKKIRELYDQGFWRDDTIYGLVWDNAGKTPDKTAIRERARTISYARLVDGVDRLAGALAGSGLSAGDRVAVWLPSRIETAVALLACSRNGYVCCPSLHRDHMVGDIVELLERTEAAGLIAEAGYGADGTRKDIFKAASGVESLKYILMLDPRNGNEDLLPSIKPATAPTEIRTDPDSIVYLAFTSGTTGRPKGVMHSTNTLTGSLFEYSKRIGLDGEDVVIMGSPFAHQVGFLYGIMVALTHGIELIAFDIWDASEAARLIQERGATYTLSSTPFLADLTDLEDLEKYDISSLKAFVCGGAPVPSSLAKRAIKNLKTNIVAAWGMTENSAATITRPEDPDARVYSTDGVALPGMEVRVIGDDGQPLPAGEVGALQSKGAANFIGYLKRPELYAHDEDGWFDTGDLARMDEEGYIRITGRSKDVIIRGGENIPVAEVEDLIYTHPAILDAAIVAMQDERLGERACAFVTLKPGEKMELGELVAFLTDKEMTRTYLPERLEVIEEMPRTASGKIQKFILRETAKGFSA
ncbi:MAG: AMP-binding protein [Rhodospirillales bacterium]|nr:AMP-binding protein [Rhodospirillales bacterium]